MTNANIVLAQSLYAAFGRGEINYIIDALAADVHWECVGRQVDFPTFGPRQGRSAVAEFFSLVGSELSFYDFSPNEFFAAGDKVFCLGHYAMTVNRTGRRMESDWIHVFTLADGKVTDFREFLDTARAVEAWRN
ncbi:MAG TPA: nuclear transport factor 2 family protein [Pseudolabrys sp.]|nr:nuclear transport factor 2 family protein [Pseudolabrys sp.]